MIQHLPLDSMLPTRDADSHFVSAEKRTPKDLGGMKSQNHSKAMPIVGVT